MTLSEFLLARIAEDEAAAYRVSDFEGHEEADPPHWTPERALTECEAKRQVIDLWRQAEAGTLQASMVDGHKATHFDAVTFGVEAALLILAVIYADHPDYRGDEWWRP